MIILLALTPWILRGRLHQLTSKDLDAARALWHQSAVTDYDLDVEVSGAQSGRYAIEVRGGKLRRITRDGEPANPADGDYWTVEGLFRTIEQELYLAQSGTDAMQLPSGAQIVLLGRFDLTMGYPIDYVRQVTGASQSVRIHVHGLVPR